MLATGALNFMKASNERSQMTDNLLAFEVEINYHGCVVFAETEAKAKWKAVKSYWEAFGRTSYWPTCSIKRNPRYDKFNRKEEGNIWSRDIVEDSI
jgi:hypothetical protein